MRPSSRMSSTSGAFLAAASSSRLGEVLAVLGIALGGGCHRVATQYTGQTDDRAGWHGPVARPCDVPRNGRSRTHRHDARVQLTSRLAFLLTLPPLMWAGNAVIGRLMVGYAPPVLLNLIRWIGALLILLPLGWGAFGTRERRAQVRERWPHLAMLGLLGVGMYNALQYMALRTSSPLNVTLIAASMPLWMMLNGLLFFHVRPGARDLAAAALSLAGVVTVLTRGHLLELAQIRLVPGDLLILVAIFCWSIYSWFLAKPPPSMRGHARPQWNWAEFLLVQVV